MRPEPEAPATPGWSSDIQQFAAAGLDVPISRVLSAHVRDFALGCGFGGRADEVAGTFQRLTGALTWPVAVGRRRSTLTADGLPVEFSVSLPLSGGVQFRYGWDPGDLDIPLAGRAESSEAVIADLFRATGSSPSSVVHAELKRALLLESPSSLSGQRFATWAGMAHTVGVRDCAKVYYNLRPAIAAGQRIVGLAPLEEMGLDLAHAEWFFAQLPGATPSMVGVDYRRDVARAKVYARLREGIRPQDLARIWELCDGRHSKQLARALLGHLTGEALPPSSVMVSVSGGRREPPGCAAFIDIGRILPTDEAVSQVVHEVVRDLGGDPSPYACAVAGLRGEGWSETTGRHTLLGLVQRRADAAVTVYFRPTRADLAVPVQHDG